MQSSQHSKNLQIYGPVCSLCLSINRSTTPALQLPESWLNWAPFNIYLPSMQLCWECKARLKNHSEFCDRAERAQQLLDQANTQDSLIEKSLSKLVTSDTLFISIDSQIPDDTQFVPVMETIKNEPDVLKQEVEILANFEITNEYKYDYYESESSNSCDETVPGLDMPLKNDDDFIGKHAGKDDHIDIDRYTEVTVEDTPSVTKTKKRSLSAKKSSGAKFSLDLAIESELYEKFTATEDEMREYLKPVSFINKCKVCLREFKSIENLMKHKKKIHSDCVGDHKCDVCGFRQPTETALKLHREQHYVLYRCLAEGCRFVHKFPPSLRSHRTKHENAEKNAGTYTCRHCQKEFKRLSYLTRHIRETHATKCKHCGIHLPDRKSLRQHMTLLHVDKMLICDICKGKFATLKDILTHMALHRNISQKRYTCKICKKSFNSRFKERMHQFVHNGQPRIRCHICMTEFIEEEARIKHLEIKHGVTKEEAIAKRPRNYGKGKGQLIKCELCGEEFKYPSLLKYHIANRHNDDRPFRCHICSDGFKTKLILDNHVRKHSDVRPFKCGDCDKSFKYPCNLLTHKVIHTGEKAYTCDICGAIFAYKANLKGHMATHTGIKPFDCSVCGKKFLTNSSLKKHVRVH